MSEYFPPDILFQIFLNLPTQTLRRFLSVSKLWRSIITSKLFVSSYLIQPPNPQNHSFFLLKFHNVFTEEKYEEFLFYLAHEKPQIQENPIQENPYLENQIQEYPIQENQIQEYPIQETLNQELLGTLGLLFDIVYPPLLGENGYNRIVGVSNGLILLIDDFSYYSNSEPYLWNPAINVFVQLPSPKIERELGDMAAFGFWFDSRDGDYKVMRIVYQANKTVEAGYDLPPSAEVYSLNTGEWGGINIDGVDFYMPTRSCSHVYLNGRSHWIAYKYDPMRSFIMSFDMNDGVCREILLPFDLLTLTADDLKVTETMGCLAVIGSDGISGVCGVWLMKKYGDLGSWTSICDIPFQSGPNYFRFGGFWENDEILLIKDFHQLVRYNPRSKSLVELNIVLGALASISLYAGKYEESLALLDLAYSDEWMEDEIDTTS